MSVRLQIVFFLFLFFFALVIARLFSLQIASVDLLQGLGQRQRLSSIKIKSARGRIFALDGSPIVLNQSAFGVYLEPSKFKDRKKTISTLASELEVLESSISARLDETSALWIPIAHRVEEERVEAIKAYDLPGVNFIEEAKRFYPEASMAAHLLGFVGKDIASEDRGYFGIEGYYNEQLSGRDGLLKQEKDAFGNPIPMGTISKIEPKDGRDLTLYLDKTIQFIIEEKLKKGIEKYGAEGGSVIIADPFTGGILASASFPSYDPERYYDFSEDLYKNPVIASSYEPGSTFKVLILAAALNEEKVDLGTKYLEESPVTIGGYKIRTWNNKYHGEISLTEILEYSSNVGMVFVSEKLGRDLILDYIEQLELGKLTGVDLQEETAPKLRDRNRWYEIDYATASFGQGIAVTPLQMIRAVAAIANGGKLLKPQAVSLIHLEDDRVVENKPQLVRQIFKPEVVALAKEMMVSAVEKGETKYLKPGNYRIAGKTGTAQIPIAGHYDTEKTIASFVGFAPADKPKFVMLVTLDRPTTSPWGSETAAPLFFDITKELFVYYGISPS